MIDGKIISMYSRGMSVNDINEHLQEIYGVTYSSTQISRITDKVIDKMEEWKTRPLKSCYPFIFTDVIHFNVRSNNKIKKWIQKVRGWESILRMLSIIFEDRLEGHL